jgi:alpha/beta hydrolase fold
MVFSFQSGLVAYAPEDRDHSRLRAKQSTDRTLLQAKNSSDVSPGERCHRSSILRGGGLPRPAETWQGVSRRRQLSRRWLYPRWSERQWVLGQSSVRGGGCSLFGYRLAPEHPHPAAIDDGIEAIDYLAANAKEPGLDPSRICLTGFLAGGNLCFTVPLRMQHHAVSRQGESKRAKGVEQCPN